MNIENEIIDYIDRVEVNGALLLSGKWGCGKTYTIRHVCKRINKRNSNSEHKTIIVLVSLFGIDSIKSLENKLNMSKVFSYSDAIEDSDSKLASAMKFFTKFIKKNESAATDSINDLLKINPLDFMKISNRTISDDEQDTSKKEYVIIIDDFERCKIDIIELLGKVNDYVENEKVKTIIIADDDKIKGDEFKEFKEKVIERTIRLIPDYNSAIKEIVRKYKETANGYSSFLYDHIDTINTFFTNSKSENLRVLKSILIDFERVFRALNPLQLQLEVMDKALYYFGTKSYDNKTPQAEGKDKNKKVEIDFEKEDISIPTKALDNWIEHGIWEEDLLIYEFKDRFIQENRSDDQIVLHSAFWAINDSIIQKGLPIAIESANKGKLCSEDIICLVELLYYLEKIEYNFPCEVDYSKIEAAFDERADRIKSGEIEEPNNRRFISDDVVIKMKEQAQSIYKKAFHIDERKIDWNNRIKFIHVMENKRSSRIYALRELAYEEFDMEMMKKFLDWYSSSTNEIKRSLASMLCNTFFSDYRIGNKRIKTSNTYNTMIELKKRIQTMMEEENDSITKWMHRSFIRELDIITKINDQTEG